MDLETLAVLRTDDGVRALATAAEVSGADPLRAAAAMRARGVPATLAAAALTQIALRRQAAGKFGAEADRMFFTRPGLEQATRSVVADRRADRLAAAGVATLADLGCGIGADALAAARRGIAVHAVDAEALGLADRMTVACADATGVAVERYEGVFADPARRRAGGARVFDPRSYSPPWDFVAALPQRVPRTVLKLAPGIDHALIPAGAEAQWVSVAGDLVEAAFWTGPLAAVPRRATLVSAAGTAVELFGSGVAAAPVGPVGAYLYDPDPAVVRAHLVAEFAEMVGGRLADASIAYVHADAYTATPFARAVEITDVLPFSLKRLRALVRDRGVGRLEIRKRGSALDPAQLRRDLRLSGPHEAALVLTRVAGAPTALLGRAKR